MEREYNYAGFWIRFFAVVLDLIILLLVITPILYWIYGPDYFLGSLDPEAPAVAGIWDVVINYVFPFVATILFWKYKSATPGKMMMGVFIVDAGTGGVPPTGRLVLRYFAYLVSILPLFLGFIWIAFDKRKQSFHDKIAHTLVIRNPQGQEEQ